MHWQRTLLMRRTCLKSVATVCLLFVLLPTEATAQRPRPVWSKDASRAFPYVHLYACRNQLVRFFPNTIDRLEREIETASTMWFIDGGAHVRLYYRGSLPATDPACADVPTTYRIQLAGTPPPGPTPPFSSVVITAASAQISEIPLRRGCQPARTDLWTTPSASPFIGPSIIGARIVLAAGDACSGPASQLYPWPETATAAPIYDYRTALMWAMGQALGLADELASPSVRRPPSLGTFSRDLTNSDREILRTTYGPIGSRPYWATSTDGVTWRDRGTTTLMSNPSLGVSMCALTRTFGSSRSSRFLVASAEVSGSSNTVSVVIADENLANGQHKQSLGATNHPPRVACGASSVVAAFIDLNGQLQVRRSTDGVNWAPVQLPVLGATRVPPGIAFVPWKGWYYMVVATQSAGSTFMLSTDQAMTFQVANQVASWMWEFSPLPFCVESLASCGVMVPSVPAGFFQPFDRFNAVGIANPGGGVLAGGDYRELLGGQTARNGPAPQQTLVVYFNLRTTPVWSSSVKYQTGRVLTTTIQTLGNTTPLIGLQDRDARLISDSIPAVAHDPDANRWVLIGTYLREYNVDFVLVPRAPK